MSFVAQYLAIPIDRLDLSFQTSTEQASVFSFFFKRQIIFDRATNREPNWEDFKSPSVLFVVEIFAGVQMQKWIDDSKTKLFGIIAQAKKETANLELRVAYVG